MHRKALSYFCLCLLVLLSFSVSLVGCNQVPPPSKADLPIFQGGSHKVPSKRSFSLNKRGFRSAIGAQMVLH
jgi:hypothetical protein